MGDTKPEVKPQASADVFTKQQLAESKRYKKKRDLLEALLEDGKTYTIARATCMLLSIYSLTCG